ncbi:hypothetical protein QKU48_gp1257 [Fadolivirus algeromassiliense]|jgi:hypothetical protein|uniref:Uncharacterized protein n=1 Tax=Fadolivirus FV1/VV64 TaxID=3070911 RepID=A0A7D3V5Z9_9VIRU|nr:hypothetical protein QKU48_gp1257 [Fadolivirus algeromassiliense]QKF94715.1 hypothetical protein Fadolivirus_1_1257 [Fadolivirus FV1/VV64]
MGSLLGKFTFECKVCMYVYKFDKETLIEEGHIDYVNNVQHNNLRECLECYNLDSQTKIDKHHKSYHQFVVKPAEQKESMSYAINNAIKTIHPFIPM